MVPKGTHTTAGVSKLKYAQTWKIIRTLCNIIKEKR